MEDVNCPVCELENYEVSCPDCDYAHHQVARAAEYRSWRDRQNESKRQSRLKKKEAMA